MSMDINTGKFKDVDYWRENQKDNSTSWRSLIVIGICLIISISFIIVALSLTGGESNPKMLSTVSCSKNIIDGIYMSIIVISTLVTSIAPVPYSVGLLMVMFSIFSFADARKDYKRIEDIKDSLFILGLSLLMCTITADFGIICYLWSPFRC